MNNNKNTGTTLGLSRIISILVMSFCLLFLTGVNFFVYPAGTTYTVKYAPDPTEEESPAPVEEKSSSKTGITIQEEYIHEHHSLRDLSAFTIASKHKIPAAEKLQIVHFELVSPPPKA